MSWVEKHRDPETGQWVYTEYGVREEPRRVSARKRDKAITQRGQSPDFSKGPIMMFSEPMKGQGPVDFESYAMGGRVGLVRNMRELRNYEARSKDSARPVVWQRD